MMKITKNNLKIWAPGECVKECKDILGSAMEQTQNRESTWPGNAEDLTESRARRPMAN